MIKKPYTWNYTDSFIKIDMASPEALVPVSYKLFGLPGHVAVFLGCVHRDNRNFRFPHLPD
jgi:hypothetical protein